MREERHLALGFNLQNGEKYSKKDLRVIEKAVRRIFSGNERMLAADSRSSASIVIEWVREAADAYLASQRRGANMKSRTLFSEMESFVEFSRRTNFHSKKIFCNSKRQVGITSAIYHWGMARNELSLSGRLRYFWALATNHLFFLYHQKFQPDLRINEFRKNENAPSRRWFRKIQKSRSSRNKAATVTSICWKIQVFRFDTLIDLSIHLEKIFL